MRGIHINANYNRSIFTAKAAFSHELIKVFIYSLMFVIFFSILNCSKSYATREIQSSTLQIAEKSDYIVVARCTSSESKWDEQKAFIFTYTTFSIDEYIKGSGIGEEITLRIIGGQVGDQKLKTPHIPEFNEGEEVILFLDSENKFGYHNLKSIMNGVLRIHTDETTGEEIINTKTTGIKMYEKNTNKVISEQQDGGVLVEDFIFSLQKAIN